MKYNNIKVRECQELPAADCKAFCFGKADLGPWQNRRQGFKKRGYSNRKHPLPFLIS